MNLIKRQDVPEKRPPGRELHLLIGGEGGPVEILFFHGQSGIYSKK